MIRSTLPRLPFVIIVISVIYNVLFNEHLKSLIRYDKYELFFSVDRFLIIVAVVIFSVYVMNIVANGYLGKLYPSNLFTILFSFLVLPGVILTSSFDTQGEKSFYGYVISFVMFMAGMVLVRYLSTNNLKNIFINKSYTSKSSVFNLMIVFFIIGFIVGMSEFDYSNSIVFSFLSFLNSGDVSRDLADLRQTSGDRGLFTKLNSYFLNLIMPISATFILINSLINKNKLQFYFSILMLLVTFFLLVSGGGRLKGLFLLLFVATSYSFYKPIRASLVINAFSFILWFLIIQTIALGRISSASERESFISVMVISLNRVIERILLTKGYVTQRVFDYIPSFTDFKSGETLASTLAGSQSEKISLAEEMFSFIYGGGFNGTAGPQSFGELYANFDMIGMFLGAFIIGIVIQLSTEFVKRNTMNIDPLKLVFLAYFTVLMARVGYSNVFSFKANGLHILILFYLLILILNTILRRTGKSAA